MEKYAWMLWESTGEYTTSVVGCLHKLKSTGSETSVDVSCKNLVHNESTREEAVINANAMMDVWTNK